MSKRKPLTPAAKEHLLQTALASIGMANALIRTLAADAATVPPAPRKEVSI